jgi:hypothetical protein
MPRPTPLPLHEHAADNLAFIRDTMARAADFTAVPGWGGVLMGTTAVATAVLAGAPDDTARWLGWWMGDALIALVIGSVSMRAKARRSGAPLAGAAARRFALAFVPAIAAGALLTALFVREHLAHRLPGCWLLLYGTAVIGGGASSIRLVPAMGLGFMLLGALALFAPAASGSYFMAAGFGALQIAFGLIIARRHGG